MQAKSSDAQRGADAGFFKQKSRKAEKMRPAKTLACCRWLMLFKETEFFWRLFLRGKQRVRVKADHFFSDPLIDHLQRLHHGRQLVDSVDPGGFLDIPK